LRRGGEIDADIRGFVGREDHRMGAFNSPFTDLLIGHKQHAHASLSQATAIIGEFKADRVLAGCKLRRAADRGAFQPEEVAVSDSLAGDTVEGRGVDRTTDL
jgi:hypothetical protein